MTMQVTELMTALVQSSPGTKLLSGQPDRDVTVRIQLPGDDDREIANVYYDEMADAIYLVPEEE